MKSVTLKKTGIESNYSAQNSYDLVIIGSGIAGLTSALLWQKNVPASKVLILEKEPHPGGYVTAFERKGYVFETTQLFPDVIEILDYIGLKLNLKQYTGDFMRRLVVHEDGVKEYHLPAGAENLKAYLMKQFPGDARNIERLMDYSVELFAQVRKLKAISTTRDKLMTLFLAPRVIANLSKTYSDLLDKFKITNPALRELMDTFTSFAGVPPGEASSILTTGAMLSSISRCFRPYGYFDEFPASMAALFQERGGEMRLSAKVEKILIAGGQATGVKVEGDDSVINAHRIVSTLDPNLTMHGLIGDANLPPAYVEKLNNTIMSSSSFNVFLGLDDTIDLSAMDLDYPYNVISTGIGTTDTLFDAFLRGENGFSESCFHMGVICPSLTTKGKPTVTIRAVPFGPGGWIEWREKDPKRYEAEKKKWGDFFIGLVEKYLIPGLGSHIEVTDIATPATYARYSGSPTGSVYDMASLVTQFGPKRLPLQTPIPNVVQPKFSHGIYGSMMGAVQVVDLMLDRKLNGGDSLFNPRQ
jgi:phytoene dehydrogenase-like protein